MTLKNAAQGYGAAVLLMLPHLAPLLSPYHSVLYHSVLPMSSVVWGALIDLAAAAILAAVLFGQLKNRSLALRTFVWTLVAAGCVFRIVGAVLTTLGGGVPSRFPLVAFCATILAAILLWRLQPAACPRAIRTFSILLLIAGCSMVWIVPELLFQGLRPKRPDTMVNLPPSAAVMAEPGDATPYDGRIVWLLFDELSYNQVFDHRFKGLNLPAFDALKSKSVVFSDLKPAGSSTDLVIPSLFLGIPVVRIRSNLDGQPLVHVRGEEGWVPFDARQTVFSDAHRLGWTTGIVGWYNPYCRILAGALDHCFWRMGDGELGGPISTHTALENAYSPIRALVWWLQRKPTYLERVHTADLDAMLPAATALIRDQTVRFVFIHLPIPHPPGIYHRATDTLGASGSYIDNLALSDKVLGEILKTIDGTPMASKTTVILCSDHSWRLSIWRSRPLWTKEDEAASHGRFDARPVLMIHSPEQQTEQDVNAPFDELRLHGLIEQMLHGGAPQIAQGGYPAMVPVHSPRPIVTKPSRSQ